MRIRVKGGVLVAGLIAAGVLSGASARPADAQLRPYDPIPWELFRGGTTGATLSARIGGTALWGQRAALLGTRGRLLEVGVFRAGWRSGRIAVEASGVPQRFYSERERFAEPHGDVEGTAPDRNDSGDYLLSTTVRLSGDAAPYVAALRFGTRLPTTNNRVGLERDQTDFFAMMGAATTSARPLRLSGELGVGLHGTRNPAYEQSDVLTYGFAAELTEVVFSPELSIVGHADALADRSVLGNEELAEARLRFRSGGAAWVEVQFARGLTEYSPELGISLSVGMAK